MTFLRWKAAAKGPGARRARVALLVCLSVFLFYWNAHLGTHNGNLSSKSQQYLFRPKNEVGNDVPVAPHRNTETGLEKSSDAWLWAKKSTAKAEKDVSSAQSFAKGATELQGQGPLPIKTVLDVPRRRLIGSAASSYDSLEHLDFHVPAVIASYAIEDDEDPKMMQLVLFTQGAESRSHGFYLNVRSCAVGGRVLPITKRLINVFVCRLSQEPKKGDVLSLVVEEPMWERINRNLTSKYDVWSKEGTQQQGGRIVLRSEQRWMMNVKKDIHSDKVWEVCAMLEDKGSRLKDIASWVDYHRGIGVDRIFIYDNNVDSDYLLRAYERRHDVEIVYWPWNRSQEIAQNHFLVSARTRCKWTVAIDLDEYVMVRPVGVSVKPLLRYTEEQGHVSVSLPPMIMGSAGHVQQAKGVFPEEYRFTRELGREAEQRKPIVLTRQALPRTHIHHIDLRPGRKPWRYEAHPEDAVAEKYMFYVHFKDKSWEEQFRKGTLGRACLEGVGEISKKSGSFNDQKYAKRIEQHTDMSKQHRYDEFYQAWKKAVEDTLEHASVVNVGEFCTTCWDEWRTR